MFASTFNLESVMPKLQSKQIESFRSSINIDFNSSSAMAKKKRSSFLPASWDEIEQHRFTEMGSSVFLRTRDTLTKKRLFKEFCTGSQYFGEFNKLGMAGRGIYKYPHGVVYDGFFNNQGEFHGTGTLIYPNGQRVEGLWKNGKLMKGASSVTADDISFASRYCRYPDRRFQIEVRNDLAPVGQEYLTNAPNPPRTIPEGCYDTGGGFYNPSMKLICSYNEPTEVSTLEQYCRFMHEREREVFEMIIKNTKNQERVLNKLRQMNIFMEIVSIPPEYKEKWILRHCRKAWDETTGYRADLYEMWTSGKKEEDLYVEGSDDSVTEDERLIKILSRLSNTESKDTQLFSFIPMTGNLFGTSPSSDLKSRSVEALSTMFLPIANPSEFFRDKVIKRAQIYHAKNRSLKSHKRRTNSRSRSRSHSRSHSQSHSSKSKVKN